MDANGKATLVRGDPEHVSLGLSVNFDATTRAGWVCLAETIQEFFGVRQEPAPAPAPAPTPPPEPPPAVSTAAHWGSYAEPDDIDTIRSTMLRGDKR